MNNKTFAIRALIVVIAVLVFISFSIGIAVALFQISIKSGVNTISTSAANVTMKIGSDTSTTTGSSFKDTKLFDNLTVSPGGKTGTQFIKLHNGSGSRISVNIQLDDINKTGDWILWSKNITNSDSTVPDQSQNFSELNSDKNLLKSGAQTVEVNEDLIIAVAIQLHQDSNGAEDSISFTLNATIKQLD